MSITISLLPWTPYANRWRARMNADADRLIGTLGDGAYATAADLAWREDMGLLRAADAGHWSRVTLEIGRRMALAEPGFPASMPQAASDNMPTASYARAS